MLVQVKQIAAEVPNLPNWIPHSNPPNGSIIEKQSFLGPFFALSPLTSPQAFFPDAKHMSSADKRSMGSSIQEALRQYQGQLYSLVHGIVRSGSEGRREVLDWFAEVLGANGKRKALQVDGSTVASDGFMINVVAVLNKFAEPFIDINCNRVSPNT
jgi:ubiquitin conjugation factor E4 B